MRESEKELSADMHVSGVRRSLRVVRRDCCGTNEEDWPDFSELSRFWTRMDASVVGAPVVVWASEGAVAEALGKKRVSRGSESNESLL